MNRTPKPAKFPQICGTLQIVAVVAVNCARSIPATPQRTLPRLSGRHRKSEACRKSASTLPRRHSGYKRLAKLPNLTGSIRVGTQNGSLPFTVSVEGQLTVSSLWPPRRIHATRVGPRAISRRLPMPPSVFAPLADLSAAPIILCMNDWPESFRTVSCPCAAPVRMCEDHGAVSRRTLFRILGDHQPIEAWRVVCGARWPRSSAHCTARQGPNDARLPDVQSESAARV